MNTELDFRSVSPTKLILKSLALPKIFKSSLSNVLAISHM